MAIHSSILAWRIPWIEKTCRFHGVAKSQTRLSDFTFIITEPCSKASTETRLRLQKAMSGSLFSREPLPYQLTLPAFYILMNTFFSF